MKQKINDFVKWDTHHHINPPFYVDFVSRHGYGEKVYGMAQAKWSPEMMLKWINELKLEKAVMSFSMPGLHFGDGAESRKISRECNDYMAGLIKEHPGKLGAFAAMPLPDVGGAVEELKYALDVLNFDGIGLLSNLNNKYLGDRSFEPFLSEADKRNAVIYIHPLRSRECADYEVLNYTYFIKMDTAKTIIDFMRSGYHKKYPNIRFILSHGGGTLPAIMSSALEGLKAENPNIVQEFEQWRTQLFADTALVVYPDETMATMLKFYGANHIIYGSDLCWATMNYKYFINQFSRITPSTETIEGFFTGNVKALFGGKQVKYKPFNIEPESSKRKQSAVNYHAHFNTGAVLDLLAGDCNLPLKSSDDKEIEERHAGSMLSMDIPEIWGLEIEKRRAALKLYNRTISRMTSESGFKVGALGAIDFDDVDHSIKEIDFCLNELKMDGICIYVEITGRKYEGMFDDRLLEKLESINVPVVIHPKGSDLKPGLDYNYFDSVAYMFCLIYLDKFEHLKKVNYIPAHTSGLLDFLSHPVGNMHYVDPSTHSLRMSRIIWDVVIRKQELVHDYIKQLDVIY